MRPGRSAQIKEHAALILHLIGQESDITLREIRAELAGAGVLAGIGTLWRFSGGLALATAALP
ncbi:hypothetical protein [Belnapia sp. F-4-1]|uniref:hypothetical protein n=1 Tax=Belnapia sp. F-4-1 TaxID=1545443 RepID=UPI00068A74CD|nr:hypothetical protein [Belnapia sp. F-4-1]